MIAIKYNTLNKKELPLDTSMRGVEASVVVYTIAINAYYFKQEDVEPSSLRGIFYEVFNSLYQHSLFL